MPAISPGIKRQTITPLTWKAFGYNDLVFDFISDSTVTTGDRDDRIVIKNASIRYKQIDFTLTSLTGATNTYRAELGNNGIFNATLATGGGMTLSTQNLIMFRFLSPRSI
ncbi:MAG: hypothetical protein ACKOXO_01970 [Cyanobium sp.]